MWLTMNKSYVRIIALSILCLISQPATSDVLSPLKLTEDDVIRLVQSQGLSYQEIENRNLTSLYNYELLNGTYRFNLNFDYSLEKDKTESLSTFTTPDSDKTKKTLILINASIRVLRQASNTQTFNTMPQLQTTLKIITL